MTRAACSINIPPTSFTKRRRPVAGALVTGIQYVREVIAALLAQYDHIEGHTLAVRGDRLCLTWSHWWDDAGNEAINLHVAELGEDGLVASLLYFDSDDFSERLPRIGNPLLRRRGRAIRRVVSPRPTG